jgi:hypothetical protein
MKSVRLVALIGACTVSLGVFGQCALGVFCQSALGVFCQSALADDAPPTQPPTGTAVSEPTVQDLKNSKSRGIFYKAPGSDAPFQVEKGAPKATIPGSKIKSKNSKSSKSGKAQAHQFKTLHNGVAYTGIGHADTADTGPAHTDVAHTRPVTNTAGTTSLNAKDNKKTSKGATKTAVHHGATNKALTTTSPVKVAPPTATVNGGDSSRQGDAIIKAWLNKTGKVPCYKEGDKMEVSVNSSIDCNLVIYDFDGKGTLTQIFPNEYQKDGTLKAGDTVTIGGDKSNFDFQVSLANGSTSQDERLFVFAYPTKDDAPLSVAMTKMPSSPFRSAPMSLDQYRKLVNQSKVYFARGITVKPKRSTGSTGSTGSNSSDIQTVANELNDGTAAPNKTELCFSVQK